MDERLEVQRRGIEGSVLAVPPLIERGSERVSTLKVIACLVIIPAGIALGGILGGMVGIEVTNVLQAGASWGQKAGSALIFAAGLTGGLATSGLIVERLIGTGSSTG